jgi:hypothetical protein
MVTTALLAETGSISKSNGEVTSYFHGVFVHQISTQLLLNVDKILTLFTKDSLRYFECTVSLVTPTIPGHTEQFQTCVALLTQLLRTKVSSVSSETNAEATKKKKIPLVLIHQFRKLEPEYALRRG